MRICVPSARSSPDMRVCAVNGTTTASAGAATRMPRLRASSTIDAPSGVGSASDDERGGAQQLIGVDAGHPQHLVRRGGCRR